ncbi:hypothetical protein KJ693_05650 [bacterium]|nr:hypothetical protein [bacterium]MBU1614783.1 hypothetical protein [bacterium]
MDLHSLGIPIKILKLCTEYTGKEPKLDELENGFKVTLYPKREISLNKIEEQILNLLESSGKPMKSKEISQHVALGKRTALNWINRLIEKKMIEPTSSNRNDPDCRYRIRS